MLVGAALSLRTAAAAETTAIAIEYKVGDVTCEGWHVFDGKLEGKRPAVLVVHQWTGISDHEMERARRLAELGYNVFVADVYGKGIRPQPPAAGVESGKYKNDRKLLRERLLAALDLLKRNVRTDPARIAATGFCFGGMGALELGRAGADVKGIVTFHGGLSSPTPADAKNIRGEVLVLHGADDPFVPAEEVAAFREEMRGAEVKYELVAYPGAVHSFTQKGAGNDNTKGAAYHADADVKSWEATKAFFARVLK